MIERPPLDGLLVVDKPPDWTSHDVVARVRRLTLERRVGHAGTLDPLATGVLVLGIGQGTRVLTYLSDSRKTYLATVRLGQTTNTYDAAGERVSESPVEGLSEAAVESALERFRGDFEQRPPIYSAIKLAGRPLYRYARAGIEVDPAPRPVNIRSLRLLEFDPPIVRLEIESSAGFYVRSLAHDVGQALGCGAHLTELRRTRSGTFGAEDAVSLAAVEAAAAAAGLTEMLWSLDAPLRNQPAVILAKPHTTDMVQGKSFVLRGAVVPAARVCRAYSTAGELIGVVEVDADGVAKPVRVFPEGRRGPNIEHE